LQALQRLRPLHPELKVERLHVRARRSQVQRCCKWPPLATSRVRVTVDPATQSMAEAIAKLKALGFDPIIVTP
jgi:hypothetical protein